MSDEFSESSSQGLLGNIGNSFLGAFIGLLLILASFPLAFWNEGRAVAAMKALSEGAKTVLTVDVAKIKPENNGKLIFISGLAKTAELLKDPTFAVSTNAIRLCRDVQTYQWDENESSHTEKKLGGGSKTITTYSYDTKWSDQLIDSHRFKHAAGHENPAQAQYKAMQFTAKSVHVGAFKLNDEAINKLDKYSDLTLNLDINKVDGKPAKVIDHQQIFIGRDFDAPQVGDIKVSYRYLPLSEVSVVARQTGDTIEPYRTSNGKSIELARSGSFSSDEIFKQAEQENQVITWCLRGAAFVMMWIGMWLMGGPLIALGDIIPFIGDLISGGIGFFAFGLSLVLCAVTIAIAWIAYRPLLAIGIIGGAIVIALGLGRLSKKRN